MKNRILGVAVLCFLTCVCFGAPQAAGDGSRGEAQRFTVVRAGRLIAPSEEVTNAEANCSISETGSAATMKCRPLPVTVKTSFHYNTALVVDGKGVAYVIACRVSLVTNFWCKGFVPGEALDGNLVKGQLEINDGQKDHDYRVLISTFVGTTTPSQPPPAASLAAAHSEPPPAVTAAPSANNKQAAANQERPPADSSATCVTSTVACVSFVSDPLGADIYVDGKFMGNTPSMLVLASGSHEIRVEADKFKPWTRTFEATAGSKITIRAALVARTTDH